MRVQLLPPEPSLVLTTKLTRAWEPTSSWKSITQACTLSFAFFAVNECDRDFSPEKEPEVEVGPFLLFRRSRDLGLDTQLPSSRQTWSWRRDPITSYDVVVSSIPGEESSVSILRQSQNHRHTQWVLRTESVSCVDKLNFLIRVGKPQASVVLWIEARCRGPYEWRFLTVTTATRALWG